MDPVDDDNDDGTCESGARGGWELGALRLGARRVELGARRVEAGSCPTMSKSVCLQKCRVTDHTTQLGRGGGRGE